jgi:cold shock protein
MERARGTVKWFSETKGFGFILYQGKDVFVHQSQLVGVRSLDEEQRVEFDISIGQKGPSAEKVSVIP